MPSHLAKTITLSFKYLSKNTVYKSILYIYNVQYLCQMIKPYPKITQWDGNLFGLQVALWDHKTRNIKTCYTSNI